MKIAHEAGAALVIFPASVGGAPHIHDYFDLFDYDLREILKALGKE